MVGSSVTWNDGAENKAFSDGEVTQVLSLKYLENENQNRISSLELFAKRRRYLIHFGDFTDKEVRLLSRKNMSNFFFF